MIVFLGNPGARYERTRHNAGWLLLNIDPFRSVAGWQEKFKGRWARFSAEGRSVLLVKPETMMNLSGESVQAAARFFRVVPRDILIVHDDVELELGRIGIRQGGGLAGHNGLRSIATHLSTRDFWRLRIGIGRPGQGELNSHVHGRVTPEEEAVLPRVLEECANVITTALRSGPASGPTQDVLRGSG